jgi:short-subunit dehydrogenase
MDQISNWFTKSGIAENSFRSAFLFASLAVGAAHLTLWAKQFLSFSYRHGIKGHKDLYSIYSTGDSWALVTGGSDGIGEQFCRDLANKGFNICIVARNEQRMVEKLKSIAEEAKSNGKTIKTRYIVADLASFTRFNDYLTIMEQVSDIDVALLVLNAGWTCDGFLKDMTPEEIEQTVTICALHPIYLAKAFLERLMSRTKRSGIIVTSSRLGTFPVPGLIPYSAAKAFATFFGQALNIELKDRNVDVISFEAGRVATKLLGDIKGWDVMKPPKVTWGCLRDLGSYPITNGWWRHEVFVKTTRAKSVQDLFYRNAPSSMDWYRNQQRENAANANE